MSAGDAVRVPRWKDWGIALAVFLVGVFAMTVAGRGHPPTREAAILAAAVCGIATFAMTAWAVRFASYPRWSYWTSALVLSVLALAAAVLLPDLREWKDHMLSTMWMNTWYPLVLTSSAGTGATACWAGTARGGWLMVGAAAFLGSVPALVQILF
jgi:hypothetical protein